MSSSRQLAAIMFTDIVGYTALMGDDEQKAFDLLRKNRQIQQPIIKQFNGHWIKEIGDGILASFSTATDAVQCAVAIQHACKRLPELKLHIGVHLGEVVFEKGDVFGDGVNIASRLESIAPPGDILITEAVYTNIKNKKEFEIEFFGEEVLKNVETPVKIYRVKVGINTVEKSDTTHSRKINQKGKLFNERKLIPFILGFVLLLACGFFIYFNHQNKNNTSESGATKSTDKSIAVLPFINMSNDPEQEYFADGMMDEILNHLFKIGGLRIISRTSAMTYKGTKKPMKVIAQDLGVANLLEGSVQKEGQRIRIRVQLIDGKTDEHLWAETYEREFKDVFAIQSDIAQSVAAALKVKIDPDVKRRIESRPTENTEAYNLYLQAIDAGVMSENKKQLLEKAIALDPNFADAYTALSHWWLAQGSLFGVLRAEEVLKNAMPLLQKALQLNPELASANNAIAQLNLWYKWDFKDVESK